MKALITALLLMALQLDARTWGFALSTGPGYRQDHLATSHKTYPHLRMFDWAFSFDASLSRFHLIGEGDMGWFSSQILRLSSPLSLTYTASGRAATGFLKAGYTFGSLMPFAGWIYDSANIHCTQPIPPFVRIAPASSSSVVFTSNHRASWQGPLLGGQLTYQPATFLRLTGLYAYGWVHARESASLLTTLQSGLTLQKTPIHEAASAHGHAQLGRLQILLFLSSRLSLDCNFRYLSLQSSAARLNSALFSGALDYRF